MRYLTTLWLLLYCFSAFALPKEPELYPARYNGLWGYIDQWGTMVIKPRYENAWYFNERVSPVRLGGLYGYINERDSMVIMPRFDYAGAFLRGHAMVYINSKPYIIDRAGKVLFEHNYRELNFWGERFGIAVTKSGKFGIISENGRLIIDTMFNYLHAYSGGLFLVCNQNQSSTNLKRNTNGNEYGLMDTLGRWIVPLGKYDMISNCRNGFARVFNWGADGILKEAEHIIDSKGKRRFSVMPSWDFDALRQSFHNGIMLFGMEAKPGHSSLAAIDTKGKILFESGSNFITPFSNNRAFLLDSNGRYRLINTSGEFVSKDSFWDIILTTDKYPEEFLFREGFNFVETEEGWRLMDTFGRYLYGAYDLDQINEKADRHVAKFQNIELLFTQEKGKFGFWNVAQNREVKPVYDRLNMYSRGNNLIYAERGDTMVYLSRLGEERYVERKLPEAIGLPLNMHFQNTTLYHIKPDHGIPLAQYKPGAIDAAYQINMDNIQLVLDTTDKCLWLGKAKGMKLTLINAKQETVYLKKSGCGQFLTLEARDQSGNWTGIEIAKQGKDCEGWTSKTPLAQNTFWEFVVPVYTGSFKTQIRARLSINKEQRNVIYSNEIDARINPGQLFQFTPRSLDLPMTLQEIISQ